MLSSSNLTILLQLTRIGIGNGDPKRITFPHSIDWEGLQTIANKQGLLAVVVDGLEKVQDAQKPPKPILLRWIGEVLQGFEYRYVLYRRALAELAAFYNAHDLKMMVLKGYTCSLDWPKPEHRPCGDIDIWQFGRYKEADALLVKEKGVVIDNSHHHHTIFYWRDFMVENHYDFDNVYARKSNRELEPIFKDLGKDDSYTIDLYGEKVYLPSPNLHALFLIRHMVTHFTSTELNMRQLLDWGFFVRAHSREIDWKWLNGILDTYHMKEFFNCINAICVEDLGFEVKSFPIVQFSPELKERILNDTLSPEFKGEEPRGLIARTLFKYKRWQANAWKQTLCYRESRWSTFWSGVINHLLKPSTF